MAIVVPATSSPFRKRKLIIPSWMQKIVEEPIPKTQEEIVQVPKIIPRIYKKVEEERLAVEKAEEMQLRIQSLEERIQSLVDTSTFVDEVFAELEEPIPMTQEEIVNEPEFIPQTEVGRVLPFSPKSRDLYRQVCFQVLPSERHAWIV